MSEDGATAEEIDRIDLERADAYGRVFSDVYQDWYGRINDPEAVARFVEARHPGGLVLELGVGTGRLARPLVDRGLTVIGLDSSAEMLSASSEPPLGAGPSVVPVRADMANLPFRPGQQPGPAVFGTVLLGFNTLFNLLSSRDQQGLLEAMARLVCPDGRVVIELVDIKPMLGGPDRSIGTGGSELAMGRLVATATQLDRSNQRIYGQHVELDDGGAAIRPWTLRWLTIEQLDEMAEAAGLAVLERYGSWTEEKVGPSGSVITIFQSDCQGDCQSGWPSRSAR